MRADSGMPQSTEPVAASDRSGVLQRFDEWIEAIRSNNTRRRIAFVGAIVSGILLTWIHWTGLVIAGAIIGITRRRLVTAILAGFGFGLASIGLTVAVVPVISVVEFTTLTPLNYATVMAGILLPIWGSLTRYVI